MRRSWVSAPSALFLCGVFLSLAIAAARGEPTGPEPGADGESFAVGPPPTAGPVPSPAALPPSPPTVAPAPAEAPATKPSLGSDSVGSAPPSPASPPAAGAPTSEASSAPAVEPAGPIAPSEYCTLRRRLDPVVVPGAAFPNLLGEPLGGLRLLALRNGAWAPIPFQVDEKTEGGAYVYPEGMRANQGESDGALSAQDELVFLVSDAGDKTPEGATPSTDPPPGKVAEATVIDPVDGAQGWVSLVSYREAAPPPSAMLYMSQNLQTGNSVSSREVYGLGFYDFNPPFHSLVANAILLPRTDGVDPTTWFDRMLWRVDVSLLWGLYTFHFNEQQNSVRVLAWKSGPVRVLRRTEAHMNLPLGIEGPTIEIDGLFTPRVVTVPFTIRLPHNPGLFGTTSDFVIGLNLSPNAKGMKFYRARSTEGWLVDGWMGREERSWVPPEKREDWALWTGAPGTLGLRSFWAPAWTQQVELTEEYVDDLRTAMPPQDHPGMIGAMLFRNHITDLEPGTYRNALEYYFPGGSKFSPEGVEEMLRVRDNPLEVRAGEWKGRNLAAEPRGP